MDYKKENINNDISSMKITDKTLGIHYRGNAFKVGFQGHPVYYDVNEYFPFIDECLENGFQSVFVATDDENALKSIQNRYPGKVNYYNDVLRSNDGVDFADKKDRQGKSGFRLGYEVLRDMYSLAACEGFICGKSQVSFATLIEKNKRGQRFRYLKVIDHGLYKKDNAKNIRKYFSNAN